MSGQIPILEVRNLSVNYGKVPAVRDASFAVRRGSITAIIGSNGAGKSTILKTILGLLPVAGGSISFEGQDLLGLSVDAVVRHGLALVPEARRLFPTLTVRENLLTGAYVRQDRAAVSDDLEKMLGYFPALRDKLGTQARNLSGGQQQMVAVARALMSAPRLLLLDEPTIGLAPVIVQNIGAIITEISRRSVDVLLVEQNSQVALQLSSHAYVLENGTISLEGPSEELLKSDYVRRAYLGI